MTSSTIAIVNGYVVPVSEEPIENGVVLVRDGVIEAVGASGEVTVPEGVTVVDAAGKWVLPGFIESHGHVGIHEEANGPAGDDTNEMTTPNTAAVRALDAVNIDDEGFRDALSGGVTSVVVKPGSGNPIGGQTVAIKTWGGRTIDEQVIRAAVSVKSALGENPKRVYGGKNQTPSTRLGVAMIIREAFVEAQNYRAQRDEAEKGENGKPGAPPNRNLKQEALAQVVEGKVQAVFCAQRAEIELDPTALKQRHREVNVSRVAVEPHRVNRHGFRQQHKFRHQGAKPVVTVKAEQRQPELAPRRNRQHTARPRVQPPPRARSKWLLRTYAEQARRDVDHRRNEHRAAVFEVKAERAVAGLSAFEVK